MDLSVLLLAFAYLILQIPALFCPAPGWRRFARFPIGVVGAATVLLVLGIATGSPLAMVLMQVSLPLTLVYLALLWVLYLAFGPRHAAPLD